MGASRWDWLGAAVTILCAKAWAYAEKQWLAGKSSDGVKK
jgi:hypothetical protein